MVISFLKISGCGLSWQPVIEEEWKTNESVVYFTLVKLLVTVKCSELLGLFFYTNMINKLRIIILYLNKKYGIDTKEKVQYPQNCLIYCGTVDNAL